ncbi:hypothetical protein F444_22761, partial [Phytophthora nicotianae P1976]
MVGDFTEAQTKKIKKMHRIRNQLVRNVFNFYKAYNHLYDDVFPNDEVLDSYYSDEMIAQHFVDFADDDDGAFYGDAICAEEESVRGNSDSWNGGEADEQNVLERRVGLCDTSNLTATTTCDPNTKSAVTSSEREFLIRRSNKIASGISADLFARIFPNLFPFGRGHPGESRRRAVSVKECVKYYLSLSRRQFAEDELF